MFWKMIEYWQHEVNIMRRMSGISALPLFLEAHWSSLLQAVFYYEFDLSVPLFACGQKLSGASL